MSIQTAVYEKTLKIMQDALNANLASQENFQSLSWLREYATVRLYLGRQAGHTTSALKLTAEFENPIFITINHTNLDMPFIKEIGSSVKVFSIYGLRALDGNLCDLLIVDNVSLIKEEKLDQIYSYAAKARVRCVLLIS
jgi:hypothetical protein